MTFFADAFTKLNVWHLLESSHQDDSSKWSNIGLGEEITQVEWIEVKFMHLIWNPIKYTDKLMT